MKKGAKEPSIEPELIFYLERGLRPEEAWKIFEDSEVRERKTREVRHLKLPRRYVYHDERRLTDLIRSMPAGSFLVLWSIDLITTALPSLRSALNARLGENINVLLYDKRLLLDPDNPMVQAMLETFASVWQRKVDTQDGGALSGLTAEEKERLKEEGVKVIYVPVPHAPLRADIQTKIKELALRGKSIKEIAREVKVSINTVLKYRADVKEKLPPKRKEKRLSVSKRAEIELDKFPLIEKDTAIYNSLFNFISSVPAVKSQRSYASSMKIFFKLLKEAGAKSIKHPEDISARHVTEVRELAMGRYREASARTIMQTASRFFTLQKRDGVITDDYRGLFSPFHRIKNKVETDPITSDELVKIIRAAEKDLGAMRGGVDEAIYHRNLVAVLILSMTGMRAFSLLSLRKEDFQERSGAYFLKPLVKRQGRVDLRIPPELGEEIRRYLDRWYHSLPPDAMLIYSKQYGYLSPIEHDRLSKVIKEITKKAGVEKNVRPHTFRATFATELFRSGVKLEEIRALMCHKDIKQTLAYIKHYDIKPDVSWIKWKRGETDDESIKRSV